MTLVLTVMITAAPPGLKNITAQLELLLVNEIDKIINALVFRKKLAEPEQFLEINQKTTISLIGVSL